MSVKITQVRERNLLIRILKPQGFTKSKDLVVKPTPSAFRIAEIVQVGSEADPFLKAGMKGIVYAQALVGELDADIAGLDKDYNYYLIFDQNLDCVVEDVESEL